MTPRCRCAAGPRIRGACRCSRARRTLLTLALAACCALLVACSGEIAAPESGGTKPGKGDAAGKPAGDTPINSPAASTASLEGVLQRCDSSRVGAPQLRRLTIRQLENSLRDIFPQAEGGWQGLGLNDVSSKIGFSNDASQLVVSPQTAGAILAAAEQLAGFVSTEPQLSKTLSCASKADAACGKELVTTYGKRLFRRPLTAAELETYAKLFDSVKASSGFGAAVKWTLVALIQSPHSLYRRELGDLQSETPKLTSYELATEIAYTFGDSTPDQKLLDLAEQGKLSDPSVRLEQARRLLETDRGREGLKQFFREWLRYENVRTADRPAIASFAALRPSLIEETDHFLDQVLYADQGGVRELLVSPFTFVNGDLAQYYGFSSYPNGFEKTPRDADHGAGILAQGSLLASAANSGASSPTQRGLLVREKFLCRTRPKPPANVPPLSSSDPTTYKTTRQHYELAHAQGFCKSCHVQFDPIGFAFEHFDQGGRYRANENGEPIDATGNLLALDGTEAFSFDGLTQLADGLADDPEVVDCVSGLLVAYAFGGAAGGSCLAEEARSGLRDGDYGLVELLARLASARHFTERDVAAANSGDGASGTSAESPTNGANGSTGATGGAAAGGNNGSAGKAGSGAAGATGATSGAAASGAAASGAAGSSANAGTQDPGAPSTPTTRKDIGITAQYQANNAAPADNVIGPFLQLTNATGKSSVPLESLEIRYYFTNEHGELCPDSCRVEGYYAGIHPTGQGVTANREYVSAGVAKSGAGAGATDNAYLKITFAPGPFLEPGQSVEVQQYFHTNPYLEFDESDDYSFDPTFATFKDQPKVVVLQGDAIVWGDPPP